MRIEDISFERMTQDIHLSVSKLELFKYGIEIQLGEVGTDELSEWMVKTTGEIAPIHLVSAKWESSVWDLTLFGLDFICCSFAVGTRSRKWALRKQNCSLSFVAYRTFGQWFPLPLPLPLPNEVFWNVSFVAYRISGQWFPIPLPPPNKVFLKLST